MILRIFTQNNRGLLFSYPLFTLILILCLYHQMDVNSKSSVIYASDYIFRSIQNNILAKLSFCTLCVSILGWVVNSSFNISELYHQPSYLVGLISILFYSIISIVYPNANWIFSQVFLVIGLFHCLKISNQKRAYIPIFIAQISIGISICLYPQNIGYALWISLILMFNRNPNIKEHLLSISSIGIPLLYWWSYSYITDQTEFWYFWNPVRTHFSFLSLFQSFTFWSHIIIVIIAAFSLFKRENRQTNRTQQAKNCLLTLLLSGICGALACIIIDQPFSIYNLALPFIMLVGYHWTHYRVSLVAPLFFYSWMVIIILFGLNVIS